MKLLDTHITKKEWLLVAIFSLALILLTSAPYLYAHFHLQPKNTFFTGTHTLTPGDYPVYFSYLTQVTQHRFPLVNVFAAETDSSFPFPAFWFVVGLAARLFHLTPPVAFHLFRLLTIPLFFFLIYPLLAFFFDRPRHRAIALLIFTFGAGFGVLIAPFLTPFADNTYAHWPLDLWVPEAFTFSTLYHSPHLIISLLGILWSTVLTFRALTTHKFSHALAAGIITAALLFFHPFHAVSLAAIFLAALILLTLSHKTNFLKNIRTLALIALLATPSITYHFLFLKNHPLTKILTQQNILLTPTFHLTFASYGFLILGFLIGAFLILTKRSPKNPKTLFLILWGVAQFATLYAPIDWQRRLTAGLQFPFAILTTLAAVHLYNLIKKYLTTPVRTTIFWFSITLLSVSGLTLSNIHLVAADIQSWRTQPQKYFFPQNQKDAFDWINHNTQPNDVFFADIPNTQRIASYTARQVYVGHAVQTPDFENRFRTLQFFWYGKLQPVEKMKLLQDLPINYLFATGETRTELDQISKLFPLQLIPVFSNSSTTIYQFRKNP